MTIKNIQASIQARLAQKGRETKRPFQEILEHYGMERFLYRLSRSSFSKKFILKGGLLLRAWDTPAARPTRDIDFLGYANNSTEEIIEIVQEICAIQFEQDDGLIFRSFESETIREDANYEGVRVRLEGCLGSTKIPMQIDIGFGEVMVPGAQPIAFPTILDFPNAKLLGYPMESVVAEKLEAIVKLGTINSRMKDFYDIWHLARRFDFDGVSLSKAIEATFTHRQTQIEKEPVALTADFILQSESQWNAFLKRTKLENLSFVETVSLIKEFTLPVLTSRIEGLDFRMKWEAPGPWLASK